jgi:hypothetical protein
MNNSVGLGPETIGVVLHDAAGGHDVRFADHRNDVRSYPLETLQPGRTADPGRFSVLLALGFFWQDLIVMMVAFAVMGLERALFKSVDDTEVMITLPKEKAAVASSVSATFRNLTIPIGTSLGTMLLVFQLGKADLATAFGSPLASSLAIEATAPVLVAGFPSLAGAFMFYRGNRVE